MFDLTNDEILSLSKEHVFYTWSAQARNAENLLILRDNHALAETYLRNWQRHQRDAEAYKPGSRPHTTRGK